MDDIYEKWRKLAKDCGFYDVIIGQCCFEGEFKACRCKTCPIINKGVNNG